MAIFGYDSINKIGDIKMIKNSTIFTNTTSQKNWIY